LSALLFLFFLSSLSLGVLIAIVVCIGSPVYMWLSGIITPLTPVHRMVGGVDSFPLLAVLFFILAGNLMNSARVINRIFHFALSLVGCLKAELGHLNILASVFFSGM
jgi:hypothetical protein